MSTRTITLDDRLYDYLLDTSLREAPIQAQLRAETRAHPGAGMQISPEQGQFMQLLVQLMQAKKYLEIGVFTGYSSLAVALALPADGKIVACDVNEAFTDIARRYWAEAGVADKIDLRLAPATETLDALIASGAAGTFDFAFIDADKSNYDAYYERTLTLMRPGGLIGFDNTLWGGAVADPTFQDCDTIALRTLNAKLHTDDRVAISMLPIGDGLTLVLKR
ncbi:MAG: class I SAM-dependent methyltransferase [Candidatus Sericytochromatia bacterium]|nr:class I SAM-dependent methyltransferase [Candidatus Sericytochromatia bacterium]